MYIIDCCYFCVELESCYDNQKNFKLFSTDIRFVVNIKNIAAKDTDSFDWQKLLQISFIYCKLI